MRASNYIWPQGLTSCGECGEGGPSGATETARLPAAAEARIERVAQRVAEEVDRQHDQEDHQAGVHGQPGVAEHVTLRLAEHVPEAGLRRRDPEAEERQRRLEDDPLPNPSVAETRIGAIAFGIR